MSRILFITGTGTGIGKTALSLAVLLWARGRGLRAGYLKPVQCGGREESPPGFGDADWIRANCPEAASAEAVYTFADPVSPHLASERAGGWVDPEWVGEQAARAAQGVDLLVVEGAGGTAVPLNREGVSLGDVAGRQGWDALIAALPGLGTLHHTITTAEYLAARDVRIAGFAFMQPTRENSPLAVDNAATLAGILRVPHVGTLPHVPGLARAVRPSAGTEMSLAAALPGLDAWWAPA